MTALPLAIGQIGQANIILPADATEEEWLAMRREGIGGSDAAAACGLSPYASPYSLWLEKSGLAPEFTGNDATHFGKKLEGLIADEFSDRASLPIGPYPGLLAHPLYPWMRASLDRLILDSAGQPYSFLECKSSGWRQLAEWDESTGDLPISALIQVQHCLAVTGFDYAYAAALLNTSTFRWFRVDRDDVLIEHLIERESELWTRIKTGNAPEPDGHDATTDALRHRYPASFDGEAVEINDPDLWDELRMAKASAKEADTALTEVENKVKALIGSAEAATCYGEVMATWKSAESTRLDQKALAADHPEVIEAYKTTTSSRRFLPKKVA